LAQPTFELGVSNHNKAPWLPVAPARCADGGFVANFPLRPFAV
jgi:hypothetical protein